MAGRQDHVRCKRKGGGPKGRERTWEGEETRKLERKREMHSPQVYKGKIQNPVYFIPHTLHNKAQNETTH